MFQGITYLQAVYSERFYHAIFQAFLWGLHMFASSENSSYIGRSDLDLVLNGDIYIVIELKYADGQIDDDQAQKDRLLEKAADAALKQIKDQDYGGHYRSRASEIIEMGLGVYRNGLVRVKFGKYVHSSFFSKVETSESRSKDTP
jgi:hypothetical protein